MAAGKFFHFTIGPVQGFVAQSRRTRDFWAGSFLLSWLAGVAMAEIKRQGGEISFPVPPDAYLDWITNGTGSGRAPRQGAIPNRFKAFQAKVPADFDGALVATCVREAWIKLAEHVWLHDKLAAVATPPTRQIWDRQHANFWDISWAITANENESSLMDQRKNWRSHYAAQGEPGVKCMVMEGWQELSGSDRPGKQGDHFWKAVRVGKLTDIGEGEQLCALAYLKLIFNKIVQALMALHRFMVQFAVQFWINPQNKASGVRFFRRLALRFAKLQIIINRQFKFLLQFMSICALKSNGVPGVDYRAEKDFRFFVKLHVCSISFIIHHGLTPIFNKSFLN